ncbi:MULTISPECIES: sensor histidine kinase [unclassified Microbacterium]|uniref:sensor histidine kinase n=1 Tax=unclassified Microbacterium TaxID=2609290 RepID=UPI000892A20E|nr:ATP-binding protein [Microbacterium sp. BH-3-3-3]MBD8205512.1 histidine kinase [Microbacterium sp. CFBP 8801]MBD8219012.1 histidine kinase [Microbacterium sp. CFBP 13617]MBD8478574.1 histidine kinase [Microbacterium sp. CFBP 8794]MBD8508153.1 histidine kinase [Microbacterium sp. CFBP 8790]AOX45101.1 histidine kinase [Microbacterium sp. BH-3-3-3]
MSTAHDVTRREAIAQYRLVGEPSEPDLQGLVELAATICGVPTAVINIIDDRMQHQIAAVGIQAASCAREDSMCAAVISTPGRVVVPDARLDERFARSGFVTGEIAHVRFYASSPLITPAGVAIGTLCVFDDVVGELSDASSRALDLLAHQVIDVLELRRVQRDLIESNASLEHFAVQVSHDLRNPLTALTGFIELASDSPEMAAAPRAAQSLVRAEAAAGRMTSMVTDLLDFARMGGTRPHLVEVDVADTVDAVLEDLDGALVRTGAEVTVDASARVIADDTLLRVLLQNLIANAVKFTVAAEKTPTIRVSVEVLPDGWRISVDDNGEAVEPELRERVFEPMQRGHGGEVPGIGIGLATCRRIVDAHRGSIGLDASPAGGTRAWFVLPLQDAA